MGLSASTATAAGYARREYRAMFLDLGTSLDLGNKVVDAKGAGVFFMPQSKSVRLFNSCSAA